MLYYIITYMYYRTEVKKEGFSGDNKNHYVGKVGITWFDFT